jgi:hypothetical protein
MLHQDSTEWIWFGLRICVPDYLLNYATRPLFTRRSCDLRPSPHWRRTWIACSRSETICSNYSPCKGKLDNNPTRHTRGLPWSFKSQDSSPKVHKRCTRALLHQSWAASTRQRLLRLLVSTTKLVESGLTPSMTSRNRLQLVRLHQQTVTAPSTRVTASSSNRPWIKLSHALIFF